MIAYYANRQPVSLLPHFRTRESLVAVDRLSAQYLQLKSTGRSVFPSLCAEVTQSRWAVRTHRSAIQLVQKRTDALLVRSTQRLAT